MIQVSSCGFIHFTSYVFVTYCEFHPFHHKQIHKVPLISHISSAYTHFVFLLYVFNYLFHASLVILIYCDTDAHNSRNQNFNFLHSILVTEI